MGIPKRILIVDDEASIGLICQIILIGKGFEVDIAVNGRMAQKMMKSRQYDLFLLDMRMPEIDGKALYQWMKSQQSDLASRVVFMSGTINGEEHRAFIYKSGRPFLPKPFNSSQLITIARETLQTL